VEGWNKFGTLGEFRSLWCMIRSSLVRDLGFFIVEMSILTTDTDLQLRHGHGADYCQTDHDAPFNTVQLSDRVADSRNRFTDMNGIYEQYLLAHIDWEI
jgi:hypothetical protein